MPKQSDPVFTIKFDKGLAERNRLPLDMVVKALQEIRQMIIEAGREIQRERGLEKPDSDFGLELLGDEAGIAFHKGSLWASVAITKDADIGVIAATRVLDTVHALRVATPRKPPVVGGTIEARITHRLEKIAFINETTNTEAYFQVKGPKLFFTGQPEPLRRTAVFGRRAVATLRTLKAPVFVEESVRLYGKLSQLKDPYQTDEPASGHFWAELWRDNGEKWRIQISDDQQQGVIHLWRRQVIVTGTAYYYQTRIPKLIATEIEPDEQRDYEIAFQDLFGCEQHPNISFEKLLQMRYGD